MSKILFVDLDGTIREPQEGKFVDAPNNQRVIPGAEHAINHFHKRGWKIIGISNQGGIQYGYKTLESTIEEMRVTLELFPQLYSIYFCPDMAGNDCIYVDKIISQQFSLTHKENYSKLQDEYSDWKFRKPDTGMLKMAIWELLQIHASDFIWQCELTLENDCWMIGDRPEDEEAAKNFGINFLAADVWRSRFLPGMHQSTLTPRQLEFLEGIQLSR